MIENVDLEIFESLVDKHLPKNERKMIIFYVYCFYCLLFTVFIAEVEKKLAQQKKEEEERLRKEEAEKKALEANEKRKKLEDAEKKRQEMTNWLEKILECPVCLEVMDHPKKNPS